MNIPENLINVVESILFGAGRPLRISEIKALLGSQSMDIDLANIKRSIMS